MAEASRTPLSRRDTVVILILTLVGVGLPATLVVAAGGVGLPTFDDWVYMRGADHLFDSAGMHIPGHTAASIGQLVTVQPFLWLFAGAQSAYTVYGLTMTLIALVATYLLARRFVGVGSATLVVLLLEIVPGFARISASFMTDVPAFSFIALCLLLGTISIQGEGRRTFFLYASLGVGLLALSIREFAFAAPLAVLIVSWARAERRERAVVAVATGSFALGLALVFAAASMSSRGLPATAGEFGKLILIGPAFTTLGAVLLPALALHVGRRLESFRAMWVVLGALVVGVVLVMPYGPLLGNLWMTNGSIGNALLSGARATVIGVPAWGISQQLALFAGTLLAASLFRSIAHGATQLRGTSSRTSLILRSARTDSALLMIFLALTSVELVVFSAIGEILDRYLFPLVPAAAILLVGVRQPAIQLGRSHAASHAAIAWLGASALVIALNSFAYDAARYRAGESAMSMGFSAETIDAGYEWVGYHSAGVTPNADHRSAETWYYELLPASPPCAVVSNDALADPSMKLISVDLSAYRQYLFFGPPEPLYFYRVVSGGCPGAISAAGSKNSGSLAAGPPTRAGYTSLMLRGRASREAIP